MFKKTFLLILLFIIFFTSCDMQPDNVKKSEENIKKEISFGLSLSGSQSILPYGTSMTVTVSSEVVPEGYLWFLNGDQVLDETSDTITFGETLPESIYTLEAYVYKGKQSEKISTNFEVTSKEIVKQDAAVSFLINGEEQVHKAVLTVDTGVYQDNPVFSVTHPDSVSPLIISLDEEFDTNPANPGSGEILKIIENPVNTGKYNLIIRRKPVTLPCGLFSENKNWELKISNINTIEVKCDIEFLNMIDNPIPDYPGSVTGITLFPDENENQNKSNAKFKIRGNYGSNKAVLTIDTGQNQSSPQFELIFPNGSFPLRIPFNTNFDSHPGSSSSGYVILIQESPVNSGIYILTITFKPTGFPGGSITKDESWNFIISNIEFDNIKYSIESSHVVLGTLYGKSSIISGNTE